MKKCDRSSPVRLNEQYHTFRRDLSCNVKTVDRTLFPFPKKKQNIEQLKKTQSQSEMPSDWNSHGSFNNWACESHHLHVNTANVKQVALSTSPHPERKRRWKKQWRNSLGLCCLCYKKAHLQKKTKKIIVKQKQTSVIKPTPLVFHRWKVVSQQHRRPLREYCSNCLLLTATKNIFLPSADCQNAVEELDDVVNKAHAP